MTDSQFNTLMSALRRLQLDVTSLKRKLAEMERADRINALADSEVIHRLGELEDQLGQSEAKDDGMPSTHTYAA